MLDTLENAKILDITPKLGPKTAIWPGDQPFERKVVLDFDSGVNFVLSRIAMSTHVGAHADAPSHYHPSGKTIEDVSLGAYLGPCEVLECRASQGLRISLMDFEKARDRGPLKSTPLAPRILFKTGSMPDPNQWDHDFHALSPELIESLANRGVKLVGIDTPSIDPGSEKVLTTHQAVYRHGLAVLEGLVLDRAQAKRYELIALPLPLERSDASWVRAVLIEV